jgi:hypothetical protein
MKTTLQGLDRVVLEAVSEDYQSFESLVSKLSKAKDAYGVPDLERMLLSAISNHLVSAYLIHADPPYATEVGADPETIRRYWYCITEEGREYLRQLMPKQSVRNHRTRSSTSAQ